MTSADTASAYWENSHAHQRTYPSHGLQTVTPHATALMRQVKRSVSTQQDSEMETHCLSSILTTTPTVNVVKPNLLPMKSNSDATPHKFITVKVTQITGCKCMQ